MVAARHRKPVKDDLLLFVGGEISEVESSDEARVESDPHRDIRCPCTSACVADGDGEADRRTLLNIRLGLKSEVSDGEIRGSGGIVHRRLQKVVGFVQFRNFVAWVYDDPNAPCLSWGDRPIEGNSCHRFIGTQPNICHLDAQGDAINGNFNGQPTSVICSLPFANDDLNAGGLTCGNSFRDDAGALGDKIRALNG